MALEHYYREYEGELMTAAEYCRLSEVEHGRTELTEGRLVFRLGVHYSQHDVIALNIAVALRAFVAPRQLGRVTLQQYEYDLTLPGQAGETVWHPDVAFVRAAVVPLIDAADEAEMAPKVAPDFVVEIASKSQFRPGMRRHIQRYLAAGSGCCWLVWPNRQEVEVWRPENQQEPTTIKRVGEMLEGYEAVPGFTMSVADVFARG
jgi:Uma2 family endonuclease